MHLQCVGLPALGKGLIGVDILVHLGEQGAEMAIGRIVLAEIPTCEEGKESGSIVDIVLNGLYLNLAAANGMPSGEVNSMHSRLELPSGRILGKVLQKEVIIPVHITGELKVVQSPGTNRPKTFGRTQGPCTGPENSLEKRSCVNSGLGRK